jgi:hypothetical protein
MGMCGAPVRCWCALWQPYSIRCSHSSGYEEFCRTGYSAVQSAESQPMFRRNGRLHLHCPDCLIVGPWRWRWRIPPKVCWLLTDYTALYPRRQISLWQPCFSFGWQKLKKRRLWGVEDSTLSRQSAHTWRWRCQPYAPTSLYSLETYYLPLELILLEAD